MYNTYCENVYLLYDIRLPTVYNSFTLFQLFSVDVLMDLLGLSFFYISNLRMSSIMSNDVISILGLIKITGGSYLINIPRSLIYSVLGIIKKLFVC